MDGINPRNLGIAGGILWGLTLMVLTWVCLSTAYGAVFLSIIADIFPGYSISFLGSILAAFYGFVFGFVFLYLLARLYNFMEH